MAVVDGQYALADRPGCVARISGGSGRRTLSLRMTSAKRYERGATMLMARGRQVLLVEDDDDSAALLASYAERLGHVVLRARSGEEALQIAGEL